MMKTVYLTYSGYNCEAVLQVMEAVMRKGCALMCECMLPYGGDSEAQAHRMIAQSDAVVAVITKDAVDCPYMARDLAWAKEANRRILPVIVGNAPVPADLFPLCKISDYPTEAEMERFLHCLDEVL